MFVGVDGGMQNAQKLVGVGGTAKYVCKYLSMVDAQNYVIVQVDGSGKLVTKAKFLHNTKIAEDRKKLKDKGKDEGRAVSDMEMLMGILLIPEVVTNLEFDKVSTMPLELRGGILMNVPKKLEDGAHLVSPGDTYRSSMISGNWRQFTPS